MDQWRAKGLHHDYHGQPRPVRSPLNGRSDYLPLAAWLSAQSGRRRAARENTAKMAVPQDCKQYRLCTEQGAKGNMYFSLHYLNEPLIDVFRTEFYPSKATPHQVRCEVWMSIIHGSMGLIYFVHEWEPRFNESALLSDPAMLSAVTAINRQIIALAPVLNSATIKDGACVSSDNKDVPVAVMMKRPPRCFACPSASCEANRGASQNRSSGGGDVSFCRGDVRQSAGPDNCDVHRARPGRAPLEIPQAGPNPQKGRFLTGPDGKMLASRGFCTNFSPLNLCKTLRTRKLRIFEQSYQKKYA